MRRAVARRYAEALFDVINASSRGRDVELVKGELARFVQAWEQCRDLLRALESPAVSRLAKDRVIRRLANVLEISPLVRNFLCVVSRRRRLSKIRTIVEEFELLSDERRGIARVVAISAMALRAEQQRALVTALTRMLGKTVRLECRTDPDLIGGVKVRVNSTVYDGSVRGHLEALRRRLLASRDV